MDFFGEYIKNFMSVSVRWSGGEDYMRIVFFGSLSTMSGIVLDFRSVSKYMKTQEICSN
jgi:hypothetical protein